MDQSQKERAKKPDNKKIIINQIYQVNFKTSILVLYCYFGDNIK